MEKTKRVEDSLTEQSHLLFPTHLNGAGRLFGGQLLMWIDEVSGIVEGAYSGDTVVLVGRVIHVGNSSMEVRVDTYVEGLDGMRRPINRAYIVMVATDEEGRPVRVPRLRLDSPEQQAEWEGAEKRQALRKQRREEGF